MERGGLDGRIEIAHSPSSVLADADVLTSSWFFFCGFVFAWFVHKALGRHVGSFGAQLGHTLWGILQILRTGVPPPVTRRFGRSTSDPTHQALHSPVLDIHLPEAPATWWNDGRSTGRATQGRPGPPEAAAARPAATRASKYRVTRRRPDLRSGGLACSEREVTRSL